MIDDYDLVLGLLFEIGISGVHDYHHDHDHLTHPHECLCASCDGRVQHMFITISMIMMMSMKTKRKTRKTRKK